MQQIQQQQQQQQQQPIYYMYQEPSNMDVDNAPLEFEGHVAHTAQAAPITVQWLEFYIITNINKNNKF